MKLLPKKEWHVWNKDNRALVQLDEEEHKQQADKRQQKHQEAEQETRYSLLKLNAVYNNPEYEKKIVEHDETRKDDAQNENDDDSTNKQQEHFQLFETFDEGTLGLYSKRREFSKNVAALVVDKSKEAKNPYGGTPLSGGLSTDWVYTQLGDAVKNKKVTVTRFERVVTSNVNNTKEEDVKKESEKKKKRKRKHHSSDDDSSSEDEKHRKKKHKHKEEDSKARIERLRKERLAREQKEHAREAQLLKKQAPPSYKK